MKILAIDTSCDETSAAVCKGLHPLSNVISSQVRYHKKYGGVVPFLAQRLHKERIGTVIELALSRAGISWEEVEAVAVTQGPGLAPALEVGISTARELAQNHQLPLYGVNHMAGHIASCFIPSGGHIPQINFPALALLVSGGHTELVLMRRFGTFEVIGQTLDDALGEAYDKVAKMLGLGYPGGRIVSRLAKEGNSQVYSLPVPMKGSRDFNFSYSGLKNAVRLLIASQQVEGLLTRQQMADICATFERVAQESVLLKVEKVLKAYPDVSSVLLAGGVAANVALRSRLRASCRRHKVQLYLPPLLRLCTDNAAMIGVAAYLGIAAGQQPVDPEILERQPGLIL